MQLYLSTRTRSPFISLGVRVSLSQTIIRRPVATTKIRSHLGTCYGIRERKASTTYPTLNQLRARRLSFATSDDTYEKYLYFTVLVLGFGRFSDYVGGGYGVFHPHPLFFSSFHHTPPLRNPGIESVKQSVTVANPPFITTCEKQKLGLQTQKSLRNLLKIYKSLTVSNLTIQWHPWPNV